MAKAIVAALIPFTRPEAVARLDEAAFSDFYRRTSRALWSYVYRVASNPADADDIVQEAFLRLLRTAGEDPGSRRPSGLWEEEEWRRYLYRVASHLVVDRWRHRKREQADGRQARTDAVEPVAGGLQASGQDVARTFEELSQRERALLWLACVEGESPRRLRRRSAWAGAASKCCCSARVGGCATC